MTVQKSMPAIDDNICAAKQLDAAPPVAEGMVFISASSSSSRRIPAAAVLQGVSCQIS
jgi:hypothetical protein